MPSIAESLQEAVGAHQSGDLSRAETIYRDIVRVDPNHADALHLLGLAAHQKDQHATAVDYISRAIQSNDAFAPYYGNLGVACMKLGNRDQALQCFQKALELDPQFADAYFNLGTLHFDASNWNKARECYDRGLSIDGDDVQSWQNLGMIHEKEQRLDDAVECYQRVLRLDPACADARSDLARAENQRRGDNSAVGSGMPAAGSVNQLLDLTPPPPMDADAHFRRGEAHSASGQKDAAIESFRQAIALNPGHADAHIAMGNALKQRVAGTPEQSPIAQPDPTSGGMVRQTNVSPEDVLNHLELAIRSTPTVQQPFPHVNYKNVFPEEFYWQMVDHLPESRFYEQLMHRDAILPSGESTRRMFDLEPKTINTLPDDLREFWTAYASVFHSSRTVQAIFSRFGHPSGTVPQIRLYRDLAGYKILPHPDIPEKQVTTQFYLAGDRERPYLGTCLYEQESSNPEEFRKVKQFEFMPNSGYSFKVSETSWHGVEQTGISERSRDTLMIIYYDPDKLQKDY